MSSAVTLSVSCVITVYMRNLLIFKDNHLYNICQHGMCSVLWDGWLPEKCLSHTCFIIGIFEYSSVFVTHRCGGEIKDGLFKMLSIRKPFHCKTAVHTGCFCLWQEGFKAFSSLLEAYACAALQWELMGIASHERRIDPKDYICEKSQQALVQGWVYKLSSDAVNRLLSSTRHPPLYFSGVKMRNSYMRVSKVSTEG